MATDKPEDPGPHPVGPEHEQRREILREIHARPFIAMETPRRSLHFAYLTDNSAARADRETLSRFARQHGGNALDDESRHALISLPQGRLVWERHTEFTTYTWDFPVSEATPGWAHSPAFLPSDAPGAPGRMIVALELLLVNGSGDAAWDEQLTTLWGFEPASLCIAAVEGGKAMAVTDFQIGSDGFTRILLVDFGLDPQRAGSLARRLIEIETYRTLALLALPMVRRVTPDLDRIENDLVSMLSVSEASSETAHRDALNRLTETATLMESQKSETSYCLAASQAYHSIIAERLRALNESPLPGYDGWEVFLNRRLGPALRTGESVRERQLSLSTRLSRATELLRTRVDIALEAQNNAVLRAMNRRSQLQLRLQQTVEGLSIAAVSYYIVGLLAYVAKGVEYIGLPVSTPVFTAVAVPVVALGVWGLVRSVRRRHKI